MRNNKNNYNWNAILLLFIMTLFSGCAEMLDDPTIDKDTGEDINFIIVDFNIFETRANYRFIDANNNSIITSPAKIWFTGNNANDIVDYTGKKNQQYHTPQGQLELTFDPNVNVSANSPLDFAVHVEIEGYQTLSQGIRINSEGKKSFELLLSKQTEEETTFVAGDSGDDDSFVFSFAATTKSGVSSEFAHKISYSISKSDVVKFKDIYGKQMFANLDELEASLKNNPSGFLELIIEKTNSARTITDIINVDGKTQTASLQKLETGIIKAIKVNGQKVSDLNGGQIRSSAKYLSNTQPDVFGFASFNNSGWTFQGTELIHTSLNSSYTLAKASTASLCATGSSIRFTSNMVSSFSIDADIYNTSGKKIKSTNFSGNFPETFTLENVPSESAKVVFRNNNPSFKPIPDLKINNLCSGEYEVDISAAEEVVEYQIVLKALCEDNPTIAIAPTYSAQIKMKDSEDDWQGIEMVGGIANVAAKPNKDYLLRLLWNDEWETSGFSTKFDANGNYTEKTNLNITSETLEDGRIRIKIEHLFNQSICDDMNW